MYAILGQFHHRRRYIQTQFSNFNLTQMEYKKALTSFLFKSMFVPTDVVTGLHSFANGTLKKKI